jgi:Coenzyme PQQ synthesis protein D (PqqD)
VTERPSTPFPRTLPARFWRSPAALSRSFEEEVLLAAPGREAIDRLSGTAAAVWELLDVPRTLPDVVAALGHSYGADSATIARDVDGLVDDLLARGWLEEVIDNDV